MNIPHIIHDRVITIMFESGAKFFKSEHPYFNEIKKALQEKRWDDVSSYCDKSSIDAVKKYTSDKVRVENNVLTYKGHEINSSLSKKIIMMMNENHEASALIAFLENLYENPSYRAISELYDFICHANLPITEDGCFLAYKKVRNDYKDIYSGKFDNSIGNSVSMPRYLVDEDKNRTCSNGLHFCSFAYLQHYGNKCHNCRVVVVKINPRDVVAIPADYDNTKGRCCRYVVVSEVLDKEKELWDEKQDTVVLTPKDPQSTNELSTIEDWIQKNIEDFNANSDTTDQHLANLHSDLDDFYSELQKRLYDIRTKDIQQIFNDLFYPRGKFSTKTEGVRSVIREVKKAIK